MSAERCPSSPLNHAQRAEHGHAVADGGAVQHVHNWQDIFVSVGLLFVETGSASGYGDDTAVEQFLPDRSTLGGADGRPARHAPTRTMTTTAEGVLHRAWLTDQYVARSTHVARHQHRLTDRA